MLKQRVVTALVLFVLSLLALFGADSLTWQLVVVAIVFIAAWEWSQFAKIQHKGMRVIYAGLTALILGFALQVDWQSWMLYLALLQLLIVVYAVTRFQLSAGKRVLQQREFNLAIGVLFMVSFGLALIGLREAFSAWLLLFSMLMIWVMDSGAYFAGRRFGRHKLAPYVSPGKTWEGVIGGVLFSMVVALVLWFSWQPDYQPGLLFFVVFTSLIAALSVYGDLFESLMKRQVGLKDSGKILPGHGGVLDRIDSLLLALPLFWVFWSFG